ncbi:hypothetical protein [Cryptosporangium arvum]|uniref:hypothetical protein n=1 Tax=Cryptosporangium arvum TaxID=80871 RepID=UPI0004BC2224|nr:hypothetical protein [Cryptosporangium arvum]
MGAAGGGHADLVFSLVARQPLVLVVGPAGAGRSAALTILAGPAAGGTMIDLGALWMAVDPPADRPRTVRLNGAPSAAGRKGWEAIAGAIGAVAAPPAVVLVDTFRGLSAALGGAGAAETVSALVTPGRTVVLVLDDFAEAEAFGALALRHGAVVSVDEQAIRGVRPVTELVPDARLGPAAPEVPPARRAWSEAASELAKPVGVGVSEPSEEPPPTTTGRRRWWRRSEPLASGPALDVSVTVVDTEGEPVSRALAPGGYYLIRIAMLATGSPGDVEGWVQVSAVAEAVTVPPGPHPMFVPPHGPAWTCPCPPDGEHSCLPHERAERLELPFVAPRRPDVYRVHLAVRHRAAVVHQSRLDLTVDGDRHL